MLSFKQHTDLVEFSNGIHNLVQLSMFMELEPSMISESMELEEAFDVGDALVKAGFHVKKGRGLIQILAASGKTMAQILYYAVKASTGDEDAKVTLKKLLSKKVTKEDIIDVLLKLDTLTLHALTGPIHMIDALTGWHIGPNLHKVADLKNDVAKRIEDAIKILKDVSSEVGDKTKQRLIKAVDTIHGLFKPTVEKALTT